MKFVLDFSFLDAFEKGLDIQAFTPSNALIETFTMIHVFSHVTF